MRKTFKLDELDCANCGAKMEHAINNLEGVNSAKVNFMTQKLTLDARDESFEIVLSEAQRICHKIEPDCDIVR